MAFQSARTRSDRCDRGLMATAETIQSVWQAQPFQPFTLLFRWQSASESAARLHVLQSVFETFVAERQRDAVRHFGRGDLGTGEHLGLELFDPTAPIVVIGKSHGQASRVAHGEVSPFSRPRRHDMRGVTQERNAGSIRPAMPDRQRMKRQAENAFSGSLNQRQ
jgi:hypothetical protein